MVGLKLAVQKREAADAEAGDEPGERDLGCVGGAADHAFAEEGAAECEAVEAADEAVAVPAFDRMGEAQRVEAQEYVFDRAADPGFEAVRGGFGAELQDLAKGLVDGDAEAIGGERFPE
ncbi:hypothetical protein GCM10009095_13170 [Sphingomonas molluscorum]|nr:hypothetical protein GCM10017606_05440 [Microbacterium terregens]